METAKNPSSQQPVKMILAWGVVLAILAVGLFNFAGQFIALPAWGLSIIDWSSAFATIFLGIFIEALPFLLLGTLTSGLVEVFFTPKDLNWIPRSPLGGALVGAVLGMFLPVGEGGVVPVARRLFHKGLPTSVGITFLLAAPVLNPIVIASTYIAFGSSPVFWGRLGLTFLIAILTGLIFSFVTDSRDLLVPTGFAEPEEDQPELSFSAPLETSTAKIRRMVVIASAEFFELGRFLLIGSLLAAGLQTFVPRSALLGLNQGPFVPVLVMLGLAVLLSVGSTADGLIALAFTGTFGSGAILAFLVYGPMVDIKNTLMYLRVFNRRTVAYLIVLPLLMVTAAAIIINAVGI